MYQLSVYEMSGFLLLYEISFVRVVVVPTKTVLKQFDFVFNKQEMWLQIADNDKQ